MWCLDDGTVGRGGGGGGGWGEAEIVKQDLETVRQEGKRWG